MDACHGDECDRSSLKTEEHEFPTIPVTADRHDAATFCLVFNPGQESSSSACRFDGREGLYVCVLELLPSSAQSFRLLLWLFLKFWFNSLNSGGCPCIVKALSQLCVWLQKWRTPQRLLCVAVQHFVPWLWALKMNPFKTRWKCCSGLPLPIKWPLHFLSSLLCCFFSSGKCCPWSRRHMVRVITCCLHGRRLQRLYGQWHCILQHIQCLPLNVYQLRNVCVCLSPPPTPLPMLQYVHSTPCAGVRKIQSWTTSLILARVS